MIYNPSPQFVLRLSTFRQQQYNDSFSMGPSEWVIYMTNQSCRKQYSIFLTMSWSHAIPFNSRGKNIRESYKQMVDDLEIDTWHHNAHLLPSFLPSANAFWLPQIPSVVLWALSPKWYPSSHMCLKWISASFCHAQSWSRPLVSMQMNSTAGSVYCIWDWCFLGQL